MATAVPSSRWAAMALTTALLLCLATGAPAWADTAPPDLSGVWKLDPDLSDDPVVAKLHEALEQVRGGVGERGGGGPRGEAAVDPVPGGDGEGGGRASSDGFRDATGARDAGAGAPKAKRGGRGKMDPKQLRVMQQRLRALRQSLSLMEIRHADPSFAVAYIDGRQRAFATDGTESTVETGAGKTGVKARWKGRQLVVATHAGDSESTESYELSPDRQVLRVKVKTGAGAAGPITFTLVYHPTTLEQELPPQPPPPSR